MMPLLCTTFIAFSYKKHRLESSGTVLPNLNLRTKRNNMSTINPEDTATPSADWTSCTNPQKIEGSDFFRVDLYLDLLKFDVAIFNDYLIKALAHYRGIQFACGSIILQNHDGDAVYSLTETQKKKRRIRTAGIQEFEIPRDNETKPGRGVLIMLEPRTTNPQRRRVMDFIIRLISAREERVKRLASGTIPNPKTK